MKSIEEEKGKNEQETGTEDSVPRYWHDGAAALTKLLGQRNQVSSISAVALATRCRDIRKVI